MKIVEIAIMALGAWALQLQSWALMLAVLFVMGAQSAVFGPSKYGVIPEVVDEPHLLRANGTIAMTTFMAVLFGQALAGPLVDRFGDRLWITGVVCVGFALVGTAIARGMAPLPATRPELRVRPNPFAGVWATTAELRRLPGVFNIVLLYSFFWFDGGVVQQAVTGLGRPEYLALSGTQISMLLVVLALSIMAGSLLAPQVGKVVAPGRLCLAGGIGMVAGQLGLLAIGPVFPAGDAALWFARAMLAVVGFAGAFFVVPIQTFLQHGPPPGKRGQTFALNNFLNFVFIFLAGGWYLACHLEGSELGPTVAVAGAAVVLLVAILANRRHVLGMKLEG